jgi:D-isomer specific 2-hydroxyacid dehydrogenase, catalytic domain
MSKHKPTVVVTRKLPQVVETRMMELFQTKLSADDHAMTKAELVEAVKTADVLVPTVTDRIDKSILMQAGDQLKLIANFGGNRAWHYGHQYAGCSYRRHSRHDHGAYHGGGAAPD